MSGQSAIHRAFDAALDAGRLLEAAQLARALNRRGQAAQLFERVGEFFEAALLYRESGQGSFALAAAVRVKPSDSSYFAAARLAIGLSAALRSVRHELDTFLEPYLGHPPVSQEDIDAFFLLAQLYEIHDYSRQAIALYRRIASMRPAHPAAGRLRLAEAAALKQATTETVASVEDLRAARELAVRPPALPRSRVRPGVVLGGRYHVLRLLGTGSTSSVFHVHDEKLDEDVALKLLENTERDATQDVRFRREVSLARRLSHPNIVRLYDLGEHGGQSFLTMELLEGRDLGSYEGDRSPAALLALLQQALAGLGHAHAQHVVHRDIKPENLFVTRDGGLKIADFGIAKTLGDARITRAGSMGGTPYYMSPEQITDFGSADYRTDLYALGVVAYELFTGQVPFDAPGLTQLLLQHLEQKPASMRSLRPELPEELDRVVLKLLEKGRDQRFQSCAEVDAALRRISL